MQLYFFLLLSTILISQVLTQSLMMEELLRDITIFNQKRAGARLCRDPPPSRLQNQWMAESGGFCNHHSFRSVLPFQELEDLRSSSYSILEGDKGRASNCSAPEPGNKPPKQRSFCPWTVTTSHNSSRYPVKMDVAQLRCAEHDHCIDEGGQEMVMFKCEPVHMDIPVLIKTGATDKHGFCAYKSHYERVAVGFTCAHPKQSNSAAKLNDGKRENNYEGYYEDEEEDHQLHSAGGFFSSILKT